MPMLLASLMANGDAGDAITLRIVAVTRNQIDYAQRIEKDKKEKGKPCQVRGRNAQRPTWATKC